MEKGEFLKALSGRLVQVFKQDIGRRWENAKLVSSVDRDYHTSHARHGLYNGFLIDFETYAIVISLSSVSLKILFFEKPLFAKRVISILDSSSDKQLERALPYMEEWPYTVLSLRLVDDKLSMCGDSVVDCQTTTIFSTLKNRIIREVERSDEVILKLTLDDDGKSLSDAPLNQILDFLIWLIRNPEGTTFEAKEAGKLEFLGACE